MMHYTTKAMLLDAVRHLPRTIYNLVLASRISIFDSNVALLRNFVLSMPQAERELFKSECQFIRDIPLDKLNTIMFPYRVKPGAEDILSGVNISVGRDKGLPYVVHSSGRKIYFPKSANEATMLENYKGLVYIEGITGQGILEKSPHCYQDAEFTIENGCCMLDIGCAEALFTVENLDRISRGFLFECESAWAKPLAATFQHDREKIHVIEKFVSDHTAKKSTRIMDAIAGLVNEDEKFFVKMDIEGAERSVIKGNEDFFRTRKIKLSCCVYHRQDDAVVIKDMLEGLGYKTRYSDGYMLVDVNGIHYPYFRRGVIYAWNY